MTSTAEQKVQHTPGPWFVRRHLANPYGMDAEYRSTMQQAWYIGGPKHNSDFVADVFVRDDEHSEANARLIAAAPDLLAACEKIIRAVESAISADSEIAQLILGDVRSAILKAKENPQ